MAKYTINHEYFEHITTPEQAYILGFLVYGEKYQVTHSTIAKIEKRYEDNPL